LEQGRIEGGEILFGVCERDLEEGKRATDEATKDEGVSERGIGLRKKKTGH